jgi:hypothetical protein
MSDPALIAYLEVNETVDEILDPAEKEPVLPDLDDEEEEWLEHFEPKAKISIF